MVERWSVRGLWSAFAAVAVLSSVLVLRRPAFDRLADLQVYREAVRWAQAGHPLYEYAAANGDPFTYPPFAALVFWPFGWLPEPVVQVAWLCAVCAAVAGIAVVVSRRRDNGERRGLFAAATALVLILSAPVQSDLRFGQVSVFVVLLALVDALELLPPRWRGILIGVAAAVKLTPLLFVVYLVLIGRRRDAVRAMAAFVGAGLLAAVVLPADSWQFWTRTMLTTSRIGDLASLGNQSLNALLVRAGVDQQDRPLIWAGLVVVICGLALWQARRLAGQGHAVHAAVLVGCATIAASPVSWTHHQIWTVLAGMLLIASAAGGRWAFGVFLVVAMTLNLGNVAFELVPTPGLQYLFDNARGLGTVLVCCIGFGAVVRHRRSDPVPVARRVAVTRTAGLVVAGVLVFAVLPLPASSDPHLHMFSLDETRAEFSYTTVTCGADPCDMSWGGRLLLNYSIGSDGRRAVVNGWVSAQVARLGMRTAPGAPIHFVPIMDLGDGQRVFCFSGENLVYGQFLEYDANGRLLENPPRNLWK
ncbi:glycosyltransferase 87 family protein [Dactylosporangium sp. CA-092794]|uniref:glycosyltransferase 87 family protein n=1 Tax=Dactylosporangium sp. CA-092794 TaxID=3239929 RepID=UPI003D8A6A71